MTIKKKQQKVNWRFFLLLFLLLMALISCVYYFVFLKQRQNIQVLNQPSTISSLDVPDEIEDFEEEAEYRNALEEEIVVDQKSTQAAENQIKKIQSGSYFHLIAGVYKVKKNALRMVDSLKSSGFPTASIVNQSNDKFRVSFRQEAYTLDEVKKERSRLEEMGYLSWILEIK